MWQRSRRNPRYPVFIYADIQCKTVVVHRLAWPKEGCTFHPRPKGSAGMHGKEARRHGWIGLARCPSPFGLDSADTHTSMVALIANKHGRVDVVPDPEMNLNGVQNAGKSRGVGLMPVFATTAQTVGTAAGSFVLGAVLWRSSLHTACPVVWPATASSRSMATSKTRSKAPWTSMIFPATLTRQRHGSAV